jgi:prefoldin subunit 5
MKAEDKKRMTALYTKLWRINNAEYIKKTDYLRNRKHWLTKAIPKLEEKLAKYNKELPKVTKELDALRRRKKDA